MSCSSTIYNENCGCIEGPSIFTDCNENCVQLSTTTTTFTTQTTTSTSSTSTTSTSTTSTTTSTTTTVPPEFIKLIVNNLGNQILAFQSFEVGFMNSSGTLIQGSQTFNPTSTTQSAEISHTDDYLYFNYAPSGFSLGYTLSTGVYIQVGSSPRVLYMVIYITPINNGSLLYIPIPRNYSGINDTIFVEFTNIIPPTTTTTTTTSTSSTSTTTTSTSSTTTTTTTSLPAIKRIEGSYSNIGDTPLTVRITVKQNSPTVTLLDGNYFLNTFSSGLGNNFNTGFKLITSSNRPVTGIIDMSMTGIVPGDIYDYNGICLDNSDPMHPCFNFSGSFTSTVQTFHAPISSLFPINITATPPSGDVILNIEFSKRT